MTGDTFDWQTEEPTDDRPQDEASRPKPLPRRRRWLALFLLGFLIVGAALAVWQQTQRQVAETENRLEADVLSAYQLGLEAAPTRDTELLRTILLPGDDAWAAIQQALLDQRRLFGGAPVVLGLRPLSDEPAAVDVALAPDLQEAAVSARWAYAAPMPRESEPVTVTFTHTHFFRQQNGRWWLAPPSGDEWDERRTLSGERVTLDVPVRDEVLARRLADDLDTLLAEMCRDVVQCPADFHARVHLASGPLSLATLDSIEAMVTRRSDDLTLPTPSLIGLPAGDGAYDALFRGYARYIVAAAVADLVDYDCCDHVLFYRGLLERQLAHLGLQSMPSPPVRYALIDEGASLDAIQRHWRVARPDLPTPRVVHAFLNFLTGAWLASPDDRSVETALMHAFSEPVNFWTWIADLPRAEEEAVDESVTDGWRRYVLDLLADQDDQSEEPPINFDLLAACGDDNGVDVFRHELAGDSWEMVLEVRHRNRGPTFLLTPLREARLLSAAVGRAFFVSPSPERDGVYPWLVLPGREPLALYVRNDPERILIPLRADSTSSGEVVAMAQDLWGSDQARQTSRRYGLFDPEQCRDGCPFEPFPGIPTWSPDENEVIALHQSSGGALARNHLFYLRHDDATHTGEAEWEPLAEGLISHPFWLDNETVGYLETQERYVEMPVFNATDSSSTIRRRVRGEREIRVHSIATGQEGRVLAAADLLQELEQNPPDLEMIWAAAHPLREDALLTLATAPEWGGSYLFAIQKPDDGSWMEGEPRIRLLGDIAAAPQIASSAEPHVSPNGRWLSLVVPWNDTERGASGDRFWVFDLREEQTVLNVRAYIPQDRAFPGGRGFYNWSPDGVWLARLIDGAVDLFAPESGTRRPILHDFDRCTSVTWIAREEN